MARKKFVMTEWEIQLHQLAADLDQLAWHLYEATECIDMENGEEVPKPSFGDCGVVGGEFSAKWLHGAVYQAVRCRADAERLPITFGPRRRLLIALHMVIEAIGEKWKWAEICVADRCYQEATGMAVCFGRSAYDLSFKPLRRAIAELRIDLNDSIKSRGGVPPQPERGYTPKELAGELGVSLPTLGKYATRAGVPKPQRGQRGFKYSAACRIKICQTIVSSGSEVAVIERCKTMLKAKENEN